MGVFEFEKFAAGTFGVAHALADITMAGDLTTLRPRPAYCTNTGTNRKVEQLLSEVVTVLRLSTLRA
jgi:hypothetical protein